MTTITGMILLKLSARQTIRSSDRPSDFDGDKLCDMNDDDIDDDGFSNDVENPVHQILVCISTPDDFDGDGSCDGLDKDDDNDGLDDVSKMEKSKTIVGLLLLNSSVVEIQTEMDATMTSHKRRILMGMAS